MRLLLVLLLVGVPTGAANGERLEELPADLHAVRVRSGVALVTMGESQRQVRRVRLREGWYFTTVGYERLLVKTAEWQQSLSAVSAKAEACASMADTYARQVAQACASQPEPQPPEHAIADFLLVAVSAFVLGVVVGRRARRHT